MKLLLDNYKERAITIIVEDEHEPVWLLHTNRGYVLSDGWLTDWVLEYGVSGNPIAIDNLFNITNTQFNKLKNAIHNDSI